MNIFHVTAEVAALREGLVTFGALEWSDSGMLPEVVTQIAALLEDAVTSFVLTFEE